MFSNFTLIWLFYSQNDCYFPVAKPIQMLVVQLSERKLPIPSHWTGAKSLRVLWDKDEIKEVGVVPLARDFPALQK